MMQISVLVSFALGVLLGHILTRRSYGRVIDQVNIEIEAAIKNHSDLALRQQMDAPPDPHAQVDLMGPSVII